MATPTTPRELRQAIALLRECLDPQLPNELRPSAPQAVFPTGITVGMPVYRRLNRNATPGSAVGAFLESPGRLSSAKRAQDKTLSSNTGGFGRARSRLTEERFASRRRPADPVRPGVWKSRWRPTKKNRQSHPDLPADAEVVEG